MHVIGGTASTDLGERISRELGNAPFSVPFLKRFPDGELYLRVGGNFQGEDVVLVQSTRADQDLLELLLLQDAVREGGARRTFVVVPYFGYGRQDRKFFPGEPISSRAFARHVELGADAIITVDLHSSATLERFTQPAFEASAIPAFARQLRQRPVDVLVSPDKGGADRVRRLAEILGKPWFALEKKRLDSEHVELRLPENVPVDLAQKHVTIFDDVISTGGTVVEASKLLRDSGVRAITAACTHGLFLRDSFERIKAVCDEIYATDTLQNGALKVSVAPDIARLLEKQGSSN